MAQKRITLQIIAEECGLSRNTVSKVFNARGSVPERTRQQVLAKARELGYFAEPLPDPVRDAKGTVAVLSWSNPLNHHFGSMLIKAFTDSICRCGYAVQMYELSPQELAQRRLPERVSTGELTGILCMELFDRGYMEMLAGLGLPVVSVDADCDATRRALAWDIITMENFSSAMAVTRQLLAAGARSLGFVGDIRHCGSFRERWDGFCAALEEAGLRPDPGICILDEDGSQYANPDWLRAKLEAMPGLPGGFFCANDFLAIKLIQNLKRMGRRVPEELLAAGFDNSPESAVIEPALSTVHIPSSEMGVQAAELLLRRIRNPERPYSLIYVQTTPIFRESSRR